MVLQVMAEGSLSRESNNAGSSVFKGARLADTRRGRGVRAEINPGREASSSSTHMSEPIQALRERSPPVPEAQTRRENPARSAVKPMLRCTATGDFPCDGMMNSEGP